MKQRELELYRKILNRYWGYREFRPMQKEIILSVLSGRDTLALLPTGGGKSVTFQIPSLAKEGICIVVTPLIALMKDQVENLLKRGIKAMAIYSGMSRGEIDIALDNCVYGEFKFLYVSPERIGTGIFRERVKKMNINLIAVDEAHCISQWGHDFRPAYLRIAELREMFEDVPVLALTATATAEVAEDIQKHLKFRSDNILRNSFVRENLCYIVDFTEDKHSRLIHKIRKINGSGIVYARNRRKTAEIARFLQNNGITADYYHAGLDPEARALKQNSWMSGKKRVIVATNAFGMGIDKPDVRFVIHFDIPDTLESYFQEAGRAGRDGRISYAVMFYNRADRINASKRTSLRFPEIPFIKSVYQSIGSYLEIPYGGGKGLVFNFNIHDFAERYKLNSVTCYYALKTLESYGYLELTDNIANPSKIHFTVSRDELYRFQVANEAFDGFIKLLLRSYSGVFNGYTAIDEQFLAKKSSATRDTIYQYLVRLSRMNIISYIPQRKSPLIIMTSERLDSNSLFISSSSYTSRKNHYLKKLNSVFSYATSHRCRSVMLLEYFGESDADECGLCDICKSRENNVLNHYDFGVIRDAVLSILKVNDALVEELIDMIDHPPDKVIEVVRWLLDHKYLLREDGDKLKLAAKNR